MTLKRKASAKSDNPSPSKRQKYNSDSNLRVCQLCTSSDVENVVTVKITSKGKSLEPITGHNKCIRVIPEIEWEDENKPAKVCVGGLAKYKTRFKLKCNLCPEMHGAKVQCTIQDCLQSFHINCATVGQGLVFDTEIETYGLLPWILLCARHNQKRLTSKKTAKTPLIPVSSGRALSIHASSSPRPDTSGSSHSNRQGKCPNEVTTSPTAMRTPPGTLPTTPNTASSPPLPPSPPLTSDTPTTPEVESNPFDEEMGNAVQVIEEEAPTASLKQVVLTPEQIKIVSDFLFTDPTWDELIRETMAGFAPSTSGVISTQ